MNDKMIFKYFCKYITLNILGQIAYSCYTMADTFFVSAALGADGLTALNLAFPMFCLINGTGLLIGMGGGTGFSIFKSRGDNEKGNRIFTNAVMLCMIFSVIFVFTGLFLSEKLTKILGADETVFSLTHTYLKVMLLFAPAFLMNSLMQCFVRNDGSPSRSMLAMITGSASNVILDYVFIFPLHMGIFGAIFATGLSPVISMIVLSPYFIQRKNTFHLVKISPSKDLITGILSGGVPSFVTELTSGIVMLLFNFIILRISGNTGVAAFGVITVISLVVVAIYTGLSQGVQPLISTSYGKDDMAAVKKLRRYAMITAVILSCLIYSVICFRSSWIVSVFNGEENQILQNMAETGLKLYFLACPFIGYNIVNSTYFTSCENTRPAKIISVLRGIVILVPMAFLLSAVFGMTGVWCAYPASEFVVSLVGVYFHMAEKHMGVYHESAEVH